MVTQYNPKDAVNFANYCQSLYDRGMKSKDEPVTQSDFENWKISVSAEKKSSDSLAACIKLHEAIKNHGNMFNEKAVTIRITGDGARIDFFIENTHFSYLKGEARQNVFTRKHFSISEMGDLKFKGEECPSS